MALSTQVKTLRALQQLLLGDGRSALAGGSEPKPHFRPGDGTASRLPRSTPEAEGLSSTLLDGFYRAISAAPLANAHALMVLRHGKVVSEGAFAPFRQDVWHVTHSLAKSLLGTAVGIAIGEGLFTLEDKIADHFPTALGLFTPRRIRAVTIRHLLTMTSGISYNEVNEAVETDWIKGIFSSSVTHEPGERFVYNSMNSYLLSALICKRTGGTVMEYLAPRLLEPMGFGPIAWEKSPAGHEKGGWGLYMMLEDMAKLGQLYLQKGRWLVDGQERQLLPESWVEEATRKQAVSPEGDSYGYHIWLEGGGDAFIMNGMFGQYVNVIPRLDMVIVMTAGNPRMFTDSAAYHVMRQHFYGLQNLPESLPENPRAYGRLQSTLSGLRFITPLPPAAARPKPLPRPPRHKRWGTAHTQAPGGLPPEVQAFCGTTWRFARNRAGLLPIIVQVMNNNFPAGLQSLRIDCDADTLLLTWAEGAGEVTLPVGFDEAKPGRIRVGKETFLIASRARLRHNEDDTLVLIIEVCLLEHSSFRQLKLSLTGGKLRLQLDEQPQFTIALENIVNQSESTGAAPQGSGLAGLLRNIDYLNYRVAQFSAPQLMGTPEPPEDHEA